MLNYRTIERSRPNGHHLELGVYNEADPECRCFVVKEDDDRDGVEFDGNEAAARNYYAEAKAELAKTPNWAMQEAYDDAHGTDNGYDSYIEDCYAMRRREAGEY